MQVDTNNAPGVAYNIPKNLSRYINEYILFFSEDKDPKVLFHSIDPGEVYKKSDEIQSKLGKVPTVIKITDPKKEISHVFLHGL